VLGALGLPALAAAQTLPDGRAYEMVTPLDKNGLEVGPGIGSTNGNAVDWQTIGGCCGSTSAASELLQSNRTASGWQTTAKTPTPPAGNNPLVGLFEEQQPVWYSSDLSKTIYTTPAFYPPGVANPPGPGSTSFLDLYEQSADGTMTWLSQGPQPGAGSAAQTATFDGASSDGDHVGFDTAEQLTPDATGLADLNTPAQFLYERNVSEGTTELVDIATTTLSAPSSAGDTTISVGTTSAFAGGQNVTIGTGSSEETDQIASVDPSSNTITLQNALNNGHASGDPVEALISPDGAILGNGNWLDQGFEPADVFGTTTNAISSDGSKIFFETPPSFAGGGGSAEGVGPPHLYMRDEATNTTTQLDANPTLSDQAIYEGASQDGSVVFFTSDEGLGGNTNTDNELYEFNTTGAQIGPAPPMSVISLSGDSATDGDVVGVTAISNDGSHVWFIARGVLAGNTGAQGETASQGAMNFYVINTATGNTTFIAQLGDGISGDNRERTALAGEPDINRAAIPTPNGSVLVFESSANLTNQNPVGPSTTLTADVGPASSDQPVSIQVASTAGFLVGRTVQIETPIFGESATIMGIPDSTHLLVSDSGIGLIFPHSSGDAVEQRPPFEVYRYSTADNSMTCVSCTPADVTPTGSAGLGASYGGSYGPAYEGVPMSSDGSTIFFTSPDPLTPGVISSPPIPIGLFGGLTFLQNVYEWHNGTVSVISDGHSSTGSSLGSTTPSGNDVFFTTEDQLIPQDTDGYDDIYDARVGGGFPTPRGPGPACNSPDSCRTSVSPTQFFPVASSATLVGQGSSTASLTVSSISAKQRRQFAKTGKLTLKVHVTQAGKVSSEASTLIGGSRAIVATANHSFFATNGGTAKLTLHLNKQARTRLASKHKLSVDITVSYSESSQVDMATLTLTKGKASKGKSKKGVRAAGARASVFVHSQRTRG
jgi:hypothetical protein